MYSLKSLGNYEKELRIERSWYCFCSLENNSFYFGSVSCDTYRVNNFLYKFYLLYSISEDSGRFYGRSYCLFEQTTDDSLQCRGNAQTHHHMDEKWRIHWPIPWPQCAVPERQFGFSDQVGSNWRLREIHLYCEQCSRSRWEKFQRSCVQ